MNYSIVTRNGKMCDYDLWLWLDWTVSSEITQNDFLETNHVVFQKQQFRDVLQTQNFAKFTGKHLRWSLCNFILKRDPSTGVFLWILWKFSEYLFYRTPGQLLLTFHSNSLIKKNLPDFSTIECIVYFGNFRGKHLQ